MEYSTIVSLDISDNLKTFLKNVLELKTNLNCKLITIKTTEKKQCLVMLGEFIIMCCEIPFCKAKKIMLEQFKKDYFLLIESAENIGCCLLSLSMKKMLEFWSTGLCIFIDDYVNIGHDQIIVTFRDDDFRVTDFECCDFDTRRKNPCDKNNESKIEEVLLSETSNEITSVVSKNVLAMKNSLDKLNAGIIEKQEVLQNSCNTLINMSLDRKHMHVVPTKLVPLFSEVPKTDKMNSFQVGNTPAPIHNFKIEGYWYRRVTSLLVTGIKVQKLSDINANSFYLTITNSNGIGDVTSCIQKVTYVYGKATNEKKGKNSTINSFDCNSFVVVTTFPKIQKSEIIEFNVIAHYSLFINDEEKKYAEFIGNITIQRIELIGLDCVLSKSYLTRQTEDNIAIENSLYCCRFSLCSKFSSLIFISTTLSKRLKCHSDQIGNIVVFLLKSYFGELRLQYATHSAAGTIYAKSEDACLSILHEIKSVLPADASITREIYSNSINSLGKMLSSELKFNLKHTKEILKEIEKKEKEEKEECDIVIIDSQEPKKLKVDHKQDKNQDYSSTRLKEDTNELVASIFDLI